MPYMLPQVTHYFRDPRTDTVEDRAHNALTYDALAHTPARAAVVASYDALWAVIVGQYEALCASGFRFYFNESDPYSGSAEMLSDVSQGGVRVFADRGVTLPKDHPMRQLALVRRASVTLTRNDVFRGVHDVFGHYPNRSTFGPRGEFAAWLSHRETMPNAALSALWCETRGQNTWTNYFGAGFPLSERPYAEQKAGLAPAFLI